MDPLRTPCGPPMDPLWTPSDPLWTMSDPLWTLCGPPVDPLWTPSGPPLDPYHLGHLAHVLEARVHRGPLRLQRLNLLQRHARLVRHLHNRNIPLHPLTSPYIPLHPLTSPYIPRGGEPERGRAAPSPPS
eukprot:1187064-Prorocentrum_minimum.AAC.1